MRTLLQVASAYLELLRGAGRHAVALQVRDDAAEVARVTENFAKTGEGRQADADRAFTELEQRKSDVIQAVNEFEVASARLCQLLSLDPSIRLEPMERQIIPSGMVPEMIPLPELLAIALTQRPELRQQQAAVRAAMLELQHAKMLPFSPQVLIGYSAGTFGGGSNLITPAAAALRRFRGPGGFRRGHVLVAAQSRRGQRRLDSRHCAANFAKVSCVNWKR